MKNEDGGTGDKGVGEKEQIAKINSNYKKLKQRNVIEEVKVETKEQKDEDIEIPDAENEDEVVATEIKDAFKLLLSSYNRQVVYAFTYLTNLFPTKTSSIIIHM